MFLFIQFVLGLVCPFPLSLDGTQIKNPTIRLWLELNIEDENFRQIPRTGWKYVSENLWKISFNFRPFWQHHTSDSCPTSTNFYVSIHSNFMYRYVTAPHDDPYMHGITIKSSSLYFASVCTLYMFSITIWPVGELWGPTLLQKQPISVLLELRLLPHGDKSILNFQKKSKCCYKLIIKMLN